MTENGPKVKKVISTRKYSTNTVPYEVRKEVWDGSDTSGEDIEMTMAYTPEGHWIGEPKLAQRLCKDKGIKPELADDSNNICSIGYCEKDKKWYGWSHRAIFGFKVGDKLFDEKYGDDKTHFAKHGAKTIKTDADAKESARRFARYVS